MGIHHRLFCEDNFIYIKFQEIVPNGVFFNITEDHSLQPQILLNSVFEMRQELWKTIRKTHVVEFPFNTVAGTQSIGLKIALQIHSGSAQKGNNVLKFCKLHKIFAKLSLFL